jgi:4-oxalocrotonate tautomerase
MPLIRIDVIEGRPAADIAAIGTAVHRALVECFSVLERDQFQVITEHRRGHLVYNAAYLGIERTDGIVVVQVFLSSGRSPQLKQKFYARTVQLIAETAHTRPQDVMITLVENEREDWSFGNGVAQYVTLPKDEWK